MDRTIEIEELLGEAGWLRRLAASLVGDGAQAEDLVQDTWVAALRRPPHADGEPRPWLARVARNLARNARRDRERREAREGWAQEARASAEPGVLAQEAEAQRLLAEAVTRLPEPLRAVIVLRYFQGLDSSAVAARLSVPASTVRTRLSRALEELRADLDRRCEGGRKAWGLLLLPMLRESPFPTAALGSWPLWVAAAGAACTLAVLGARSLAPKLIVEESASPSFVTSVPSASETANSESIPLSNGARAGSERVAGAIPVVPAVTASILTEVSGILLVDGRPPKWPILLTLEPGGLADQAEPGAMPTPFAGLTVELEQRGAFTFDGLSPEWSGKLRVVGYTFADGESSRSLEAPTRGLVFELRPGPVIVGRIVSPDGLGLAGLPGTYRLLSGHEGAPVAHESLTTGFECRGDGAFRIPIQTSADWGKVSIRIEDQDLGYLDHESQRFALAAGLDLGDLALEPLHPLEFTVRNPAGAPIAGAFARVDGPGLSNQPTPLTGADGSGVLAVVPNRTVSVRFGATAHRDRVVNAEPRKRLEVVLEPLAVLDVRYGKTVTLVRVSADRSAFVWDDDKWGAEELLRFEYRGDRPRRRSLPAAPGQRFEYEFQKEGGLELVGIRPDVELLVEALDAGGRSLGVRIVSVELGGRAAIEL